MKFRRATSTNLAIDCQLLEKARLVGRLKTNKEAVTSALREYIPRSKNHEIQSLFGTVDVDPNYDHKQERRAQGPTILKSRARSGVLR